MSKGLADSGIEKWTFDTNKMTITYYDKGGNEILVPQSNYEIERNLVAMRQAP